MPLIKFESDWLKAKDNVNQGDRIKFVNAGVPNEKGDWIFNVTVIEKTSGNMLYQKKFQLNKTNWKTIKKVYGENSDNWVGKEMEVIIVKVNNPSTGKFVYTVRLIPPGGLARSEGMDEDY